MINSLKDWLQQNFMQKRTLESAQEGKESALKKESLLFSHKSASAYKDIKYLVGKKISYF